MTRWIPNGWIAAGVLTFAIAGPAHAIITHPGDELLEANLPAGFNPDWVGRWASSGSAVAVGPEHILATVHQGGGLGTSVTFGGVTYKVVEQTPLNSDLRLLKIAHTDDTPASLNAYVPVYSGTGETGLGFIIGGYGRGRGDDLINDNAIVYGYEWASEGNTTRRWGINVIAGFATDSGIEHLVADFDGPGAPTAVQHEAIAAEYDSGGGWFILDGGVWKLAGLTRGVTQHPGTPDPAWFRDPVTGSPAPDVMFAMRLSPYADVINQIIPEPAGLTLLAGAGLLMLRRRRVG